MGLCVDRAATSELMRLRRESRPAGKTTLSGHSASDPTRPLSSPSTVPESCHSSVIQYLRLGVATGSWPFVATQTFHLLVEGGSRSIRVTTSTQSVPLRLRPRGAWREQPTTSAYSC